MLSTLSSAIEWSEVGEIAIRVVVAVIKAFL